MTVRFDTSTSLNNSRAWHPSVVGNISAEKDVLLDRRLMGVGMGLTETAAIDALHGYEFGALWIKAEPDQAAYAETAAVVATAVAEVTDCIGCLHAGVELSLPSQAAVHPHRVFLTGRTLAENMTEPGQADWALLVGI